MCVNYIPSNCVDGGDGDTKRFRMRDSEDNVDFG